MKSKSNLIRTFIAVELSPAIILEIAKLQKEFTKSGLDVKWVKPENVHLTLKFLGDISTPATKMVGYAMVRAIKHQKPFSLDLNGMGCFPHIRRPRVIWIGISGQTDILYDIHARLDENLDKLGFPKEARTFKAHLTLARVKRKLDRTGLAEALTKGTHFKHHQLMVNEIVLFKSQLRPTGAVYTKLMHVPLKP
jgi:2'-5' RNA ligase